MPFSSLPQSAFVDDGAGSYAYQPQYQSTYTSQPFPSTFSPTNELGRKTFLWYRVYCGALAALYGLVTGLGLMMTYFKPGDTVAEAQEMMITGVAYAVVGAIFFAIFVFALMQPPKPYNWIVGIVMIAIGLTSCCMWPATVPLLIYWMKPETRAFFGRN